MWEVAVSKGVCPGRSWMSLKERFSKTILKRKGIAFFVSAAAGPSSSSASSPEKAPQQATRTFQPNAYTHEQVGKKLNFRSQHLFVSFSDNS